MTASETLRAQAQARQVRRAWLVVLSVSLVFVVLAAGVVAAGRFYWGHATTREAATLQVISGNGALLRTPNEREWRLVTGATTVHEGDDISTALGTVVWLTMFDGSTVEVSEDTVVHIARMRSSRFLKRTKHFILEPQRGALYVGMAPHGEYDYVEFTLRTPLASLTMADEAGRDEAGSFLIEVLTSDTAAPSDHEGLRAAVLRGAATLKTAKGQQRLTSTQQTLVALDGGIGPETTAVRELLQNGTFSQGLDGWIVEQQSSQSPRTAGGSVELVPDNVDGTQVTALEFLRGGDQRDITQVGVRQRVGKTLRVYSSLLLQFDAKITDQRPLGGGDDQATFPLVIKLIYVDIQGREQEWSHGYYVYADPDRKTPAERGTRVEANRWQHTVFDLRSLSPLPKQITAIVVYASGAAYQTRVANLSLTSSELQETPSSP
jgi:hypothetical protein